MTAIEFQNTTTALAGGASPLKFAYNPSLTSPLLQNLPWLLSGSVTSPVVTQQVQPPNPFPPCTPHLQVPMPKLHKPHCPSSPHSALPSISDELGELLVTIVVHCRSDITPRTCVNICGCLELLPLPPEIHSTAPLLNNLCKNGVLLSATSPLAPTNLRWALQYGFYTLVCRDPVSILGEIANQNICDHLAILPLFIFSAFTNIWLSPVSLVTQ